MIVIYAMAIIIRIFARQPTYSQVHIYIQVYIVYTYLSATLSVRITSRKFNFPFPLFKIPITHNQSEFFPCLTSFHLAAALYFSLIAIYMRFPCFCFPTFLIHFQIYFCIHANTNAFMCMYIYMVWLYRPKQICLCSLWLCIFDSLREN